MPSRCIESIKKPVKEYSLALTITITSQKVIRILFFNANVHHNLWNQMNFQTLPTCTLAAVDVSYDVGTSSQKDDNMVA